MLTIVKRFNSGLYDIGRRGKIRLSDAKVDDVLACGGQRPGAREHGECVFLSDPVEPGDGVQHILSPKLSRWLFHPTNRKPRLS